MPRRRGYRRCARRPNRPLTVRRSDHDIRSRSRLTKNHAPAQPCHVIIRKGFDSLEEPTELEEDLLDQAWGLEADSRLSCQAVVADEDLVVEIPKYTINHAREDH